MLLIFMYEPTNNFLNWYKKCCDLDSTIYKKLVYNKKKAKAFYLISRNSDYIVYPLNGSQSLVFGNIEHCQKYIEENLNYKFLIFSMKDDLQKDYLISNEKVIII